MTETVLDVEDVSVALLERFPVGAHFEVNDALTEGQLFRVDAYKPMGDKARAGFGVEDSMAVYATELEAFGGRGDLRGTKFHAFPVSMMLGVGERRSNRSTGLSASPRPAKNPRECECGCGEMTKGGRFRPGHDAKFHAAQKKGA